MFDKEKKEEYNFVGYIETRVSKKTNQEYTALFIKITDNVEKPIFLQQSDIELIRKCANKK